MCGLGKWEQQMGRVPNKPCSYYEYRVATNGTTATTGNAGTTGTTGVTHLQQGPSWQQRGPK